MSTGDLSQPEWSPCMLSVQLTSDVQLDPVGGCLPEGVPGGARVAPSLARPHLAHAQRGPVEDGVVKVLAVHRGTLKKEDTYHNSVTF